MTLNEVMTALEALHSDRMMKYYISQGAKEPLFGAATGAMKPLAKALKNDQEMAEALYATGNYDAMYLAGMIANVSLMQPEDFDRWLETAYFYMISDFIVAVTLSETAFAQEVADRYIKSTEDLIQSAGWSTYEWLLGSRKDIEFDADKIKGYLEHISKTYALKPDHTQKAMRRFVTAVGVSFEPLHESALEMAHFIPAFGEVAKAIEKEVTKGRIGFKRKHVRC